MTQLAVVSCCGRAYAVAIDNDKNSFINQNMPNRMNVDYKNVEASEFDGRWICGDCPIHKMNEFSVFPATCIRPEVTSTETHPGYTD